MVAATAVIASQPIRPIHWALLSLLTLFFTLFPRLFFTQFSTLFSTLFFTLLALHVLPHEHH